MPSPGVENLEALQKSAQQVGLTIDQAKQLAMIIRKTEKARVQRESKAYQFDSIGYTEDYIANQKAAISYLTPKKNDDEVRIVGGTTEKKVEVVINELNSLNFQHEVTAFDRDDLQIVELGHTIGDIVTRTNQIERDEDVWLDIIIELCTQRAVFVQENYKKTTTRDVKVTGSVDKYVASMAQKRLISGLKVYLGDITIPAYLINTQPYICLVDRITYDEAKTYFGESKNWHYVKPGNSNADLDSLYQYRVGELEKDEVQVITYMSYPDDEFQVIVAGIPMEDVGKGLPWEYPGYNIAMRTIKSTGPDWAYGRSFTSSAKVLQGLSDETIRLLIRKFRQGLEPSMAIRGTQVVSRDIWNPGAMVYGLKKDNFQKLTDHNGVTQSEMAMFEKINGMVEEFVGQSNLAQGIPEGGQKTAQEIMELQKNAAKMLGLAVAAVMALKRDMTYLRIFNIFENYTKPVRKSYDPMRKKVVDVYRQFTITGANYMDGNSGNKIVQFSDRNMEEDELQQLKTAEDELEKRGNPTRFVNINIPMIRDIPIYWYVNVVSKPKDSNSLDRMMFREDLKDAMTIAQVAQRPLTGDQVIKEFEGISKKKGWFGQQTPLQQPQEGEDMEGSMAGNEILPDQPSLKQLINGQ
jgi:hypothetical protein